MKCPRCQGTGAVVVRELGEPLGDLLCPRCRGRGVVDDHEADLDIADWYAHRAAIRDYREEKMR